MKKAYRVVFLIFLVLLALVSGGALFQSFSIIPYFQNDISLFRNAAFGGSNFFPIISPLMTLSWIVIVILGWKIQIENKKILNFGYILFLIIAIMTYSYFVPFLINNFGNSENVMSDAVLLDNLNTWASLDQIRQYVGVGVLAIFIYSYGNVIAATKRN